MHVGSNIYEVSYSMLWAIDLLMWQRTKIYDGGTFRLGRTFSCLAEEDTTKDSSRLYPLWSCSSPLLSSSHNPLGVATWLLCTSNPCPKPKQPPNPHPLQLRLLQRSLATEDSGGRRSRRKSAYIDTYMFYWLIKSVHQITRTVLGKRVRSPAWGTWQVSLIRPLSDRWYTFDYGMF